VQNFTAISLNNTVNGNHSTMEEPSAIYTFKKSAVRSRATFYTESLENNTIVSSGC